MVMLDAVIIVIGIGALATLRLVRRMIRSIETVVYFMVAVTLVEQVHSAIPDNFKLIKFSANFAAFVFFKMKG
ncbi:hypothetical protein SD70_10960 [Gordoniibacillus kamchatkensis]|uniref:Uncharacterized protein n=1 Tax=Gordoniibacillus kamchatkensis TaxID=1590651 RepID=A0ABR5AK83_9BACL|nr:hypothetical protein [Paenibacillus sp. VKM B-2647]KIL40767.1 hypothetical protein SD70_10960 [Paenibacillus sp. VKM B-2647]